MTNTADSSERWLPQSRWESRNLEFVIRTTVINGENGPPDLVSFATW